MNPSVDCHFNFFTRPGTIRTRRLTPEVLHAGPIRGPRDLGHAHVAQRLLGREVDADREEVAAVRGGHDKLHAPVPVAPVDHLDLPSKHVAAPVVVEVPVHLVHLGWIAQGRERDGDDDVVKVHAVGRLVLDGDERFPAGDGRPAVDREGHRPLVAGLVPPLEDAERGAHREGPVGILEAEDALLGVQLLVDVGVGLELEPLVGAGRDADADEGVLLAAANLEHHRPLHLHPLNPAILLQGDVELLLNLERDAVLGHRGHAAAGFGVYG